MKSGFKNVQLYRTRREREIRGALRCEGAGLVNTIYVLWDRAAGIEKTQHYILEDLEKINLF